MRELYIDCTAGVAGDMLCAALLELCPDREAVLAELNRFGIPGVEYIAESAERYAITGTHLAVRWNGQEEGQDHPHGHERHHHCGLGDVLGIIDHLTIPETVREDAKAVYRRIAEAEGRVHGRDMEHIHFHELGSMDAIADVTAACYLRHILNVDRVTVSPICTGFGKVRCAHGLLPVPAPATALLLEGVPSFAGELEGELTTPTGAALAGYFADSWGQLPPMTVEKLGCGLGKKDFGGFSGVRAMLGESEETVIELSCNVDDMSPERVGFAIEELLRHGAVDAFYTPIGMKKTRPGLMLTCLCREEKRDELVGLLFRHTTTLGIRETLCRRYVLKRQEKTVTTPYGDVRVKCSDGYGVERRKAEYDDLARIAREQDLTLDEIEGWTRK